MSFWQSLSRPIIGMAPMDGVTDATFRHTVAIHGKPDVSFTEFTHVHDVCRGPEFLLDSLIYHEAERPIVAQLYGKDPDLFYQAAHAVCELGFDGLDINMGCPSRSVASSGSGAGLIRTPDVAHAIMQAARQGIADWAAGQTLETAGLKPGRMAAIQRMNELRRNARPLVRRTIPLSVKTRLGYDVVVIDRWIEHLLMERPAVISLHGRTLQQMYRGEADWGAIARAAEIVRGSGTLLLGNGDVQSLRDLAQRVRDTGVDGVLVGRAALGAPWFFRQKEEARALLQQELPDKGPEPVVPPLEVRFDMLLDHARRFEAACGQGQFRRMRKHLGWYCKGFPHAASLRADMFRVSSVADLEQRLADFHAHCASLTDVSDRILLEPTAADEPSPAPIMSLILASTSPRRRELLALLGLPFDVRNPSFEERLVPGLTAVEQVQDFALGKARSVSRHEPEAIVLGSDTVIELNHDVLGKPSDLAEARAMLRRLAGREHRVHTAVALVCSARAIDTVALSTAVVRMKPFDDHAHERYLATEESLGKAGAYSIQGAGGDLIEVIEGDFPTVVGLPLHLVARLLIQAGVRVPADLEGLYGTKPYPNWARFSR